MVGLRRAKLVFMAVAASSILFSGSLGLVRAQTIGPDGTPQIERATETLRYSEAAPAQIRTIWETVLAELAKLPERPTPDQTKDSELRKRILDLRLLMDFYAFLYEPGPFEAYRETVDAAYEQIGEYKDIFDVQKIDRNLNDENYLAQRFLKMNVAVAPFRSGAFREDLPEFLADPASRPLNLERKHRPGLWQIAGVKPDETLDSAGNIAWLGVSILRGFRESDVMFKNILDPNEEAKFHFTRRTLRSVEVLVDMFPSLTDDVADVREPLDDLIKAMGKTNDEYTALRLSELFDLNLAPREAGVKASYAKSLEEALQFIRGGDLDAYIDRLDAARRRHRRY